LREVLSRDVGTTVPIEVLRAGQKYGTSVTLTSRNEAAPPAIPAQQAAPSPGLGITVRDIAADGGGTLCQVTAVIVGSPGDRAGLKVGDLLVEVDGAASPKVADVQRAAKNGHVLLRVQRQSAAFYAALRP